MTRVPVRPLKSHSQQNFTRYRQKLQVLNKLLKELRNETQDVIFPAKSILLKKKISKLLAHSSLLYFSLRERQSCDVISVRKICTKIFPIARFCEFVVFTKETKCLQSLSNIANLSLLKKIPGEITGR